MDGFTIPRTLPPSQWRDTFDPMQLINEGVQWEYASAIPLSYFNEDGAGSVVVMCFTIPIDDDESRVVVFPIDLSQVGKIATELTGALLTCHGRTLAQVIDETKQRLRDEPDAML